MKQHSPNPKNRRTWRCKCGLINVPEAPECKGIIMELQKQENVKQIRTGEKWRNQVKAVDRWLKDESVD